MKIHSYTPIITIAFVLSKWLSECPASWLWLIGALAADSFIEEILDRAFNGNQQTKPD